VFPVICEWSLRPGGERGGAMGTKNQFDLLVDVDNDDPSHLIAAAEKKAAASPKPAPAAPAKLPTKPTPPAQAGEFIHTQFPFESDRKPGSWVPCSESDARIIGFGAEMYVPRWFGLGLLYIHVDLVQ